MIQGLGVHRRLAAAGRLPDLPHNVGARNVVLMGQINNGGLDDVIPDSMEIPEGEVGDVEPDVVVGRPKLAAALGGVGDVVHVVCQAVLVPDADEGSGADHVGTLGVQPPGEPRRLGFQPGTEGYVQLAGGVVELPCELRS